MEHISKFYYKVYGLTIVSDIELPELERINGTLKNDFDVVIERKNKFKDENLEEKHKIEANNIQEVVFTINDVATYYINNGNYILIEQFEGSDISSMKLFLLGMVFGILLFQRNTVALHGGAVAIKNSGVIFIGDSGAGKSTLTAGLIKRGYGFITDEVSVINNSEDRKNIIHVGHASQRLCKDAMKKIGLDHKNFWMIDENKEKFLVKVSEGIVDRPLPIGAIFLLSLGEGPKVEIEKIQGRQKLQILMKNLYLSEISVLYKFEKDYYKNCFEIAKAIPMYRIIRPKNKFTVDEMIDLIENIILE